MLTTILLALKNLPGWAKAGLVGVLLLGGQEVRHRLIEHDLRGQIATLQQTLDHERAASAQVALALSSVTADRDHLQAVIAQQNQQIVHLREAADLQQAQANARVQQVLRAYQNLIAAEQVQRTHPPALPPKELNAWLASQFR